RPGGQVLPDPAGGRLREEHLTAMGDGAHAGTAVHARPEVVALAKISGITVQGHPHPERRLDGPRFREERLLEGTGGGHRVGGAGEDGEEAVAFTAALDDDPAVLRNA